MTFRQAVESTPSTANAYRNGLRALITVDRTRISIKDTRRLTGSVNLDITFAVARPNDARWDYGIGWKYNDNSPERIAWVEVHPMRSTANLAEVENKLAWLQNWLAGDGRRLEKYDREFVCISSGESSFTAASPQLKKLAQRGLRTVGRHLKLP